MAIALATGEPETAFIEVYRTLDGVLIAEYGQGAYCGRGVAFAEDNQTLYFLLEYRDTQEKELLRVSIQEGSPEHIAGYGTEEFVNALCRNRNGQFMAIVGKAIEVWNLDNREVIRYKSVPDTQYQQVRACFSSEGRYLYIYGLVESQIVMFDIVEDCEVKRWPAPKPFGEQVAVSPSGKYLGVVGTGTGVFIYDTETDERVDPDFYNELYSAALQTFSYDSSLLIDQANVLHISTLELFSLPAYKPGIAIAIASAWEAPVVAFSNREGDLFWMRFIEESNSPDSLVRSPSY
ncbi:MAG: hypothetical protein AB4057_05900 [Crocosphaera sp.]